jgi:RimJ/RimL family protein N-acetyltransferase
MGILTGQLTRLTAVNPDTDAEIIARWSRDSQFWRLAHTEAALPELVKTARRRLEDQSIELQSFTIHTLADDRLIGLIGLYTIFWLHREAFMGINIGERDFWGKGYGTDALRVLLRYAFDELNLYRVSLSVLEGNERAMRSYEKCGFRYEGRERRVWAYDGRRWDEIYMGLLREEWLAVNTTQLTMNNGADVRKDDSNG